MVERAAMCAISGKADDELDQLKHIPLSPVGAIHESPLLRAGGEGSLYQQLAATAALFPDELVESELGLIPKGWKVGTVDEEFDLTMGQSPPGKTYNELQEIKDVFDRSEAKGTVFGSISKKDFHNIQCIKSSAKIVREFERFAAPIDENIACNEQSNRTLATIRDTLLPKLLSGELRPRSLPPIS